MGKWDNHYHDKGQKDYKKSGGMADWNPITEFFHPSYDPPKNSHKKQYDSGWNNAKKSKR